MDIKTTNYIILFLIIINSIFFPLFSNQYNLPDGVLHEITFNNISNSELNFLKYLTFFDLFNIILIKNFLLSLFPNFFEICYLDYDTITNISDTCNNFYNIDKNFSFGGSVNLYTYSNLVQININKISLILYLLILNILIFIFINIYGDHITQLTVLFFLIFPSFINTVSYISPNIISSYIQIIFFILFLNQKFIAYFFISILLVYIDTQNISNLFLIIILFLLIFIKNFLKIKISLINYLILFVLILFFIFFIRENTLFQSFINNSEIFTNSFIQDYNYINYSNVQRQDYIFTISEFIYSIFVFFISLYYVGGSMSHLSYLLEYLIFASLILNYFYRSIFKDKSYNNIFNNLSFSYFLIGILSFFILIILLININQGRYGLFILLPFLYYYSSLISKNNFLITSSFLLIFILNNFKIMNML